jgi:hypothetical protein
MVWRVSSCAASWTFVLGTALVPALVPTGAAAQDAGAGAPQAADPPASAASEPAADDGPPRPKAPELEKPRPAEVPDDAALVAAGARIGEVRFQRLNLFDTRLPEEDRLLFRWANKLHLLTRESVVASHLLFKPGDPYDPRLLRESERIMRTESYFRDAHIRPIALHDGIVDLEVVTQDVWTLNPGVSLGRSGGKNSSGFSLEDANVLGLGKEVSFSFKSEVDRSSKTLSYHDNHVLDSWWDLEAQYSDNSDGHVHGLAVKRPFYALDTPWTAGALVRDEERVDSVYDRGDVVRQYEVRDRALSAFGGWSAGLHDGWVTRWTAGISLDEHRASLAVPPNAPVPPGTERQLVYPWIGFELIQDAFSEVRNQDQIGKTEDVSLGWQVKGKLGYSLPALGADRRATVFSLGAKVGHALTPRQTLLLAGSAVGHVEDGQLQNSLFKAESRYYLRQSARRSFFMGLSAQRGVRLDDGQQVVLGGDNGLRGYPLRYQSGEGRWLFTTEQRVFTNWYPFRLFNVGGAVFYDMGRTWGQGAVDSSHKLLKDVGFGLRLGNSRTSLGNVIHIDVAFPLDGDSSIKKAQFVVEVKESF